ncbi:DNA polymerase III subunit delta [Candidatus Enterococcus willemsii]|uniref:DNA polymerase III subunit delta n=1 Tax=Candidatus Enterococcus willemsii TaxID=1857215 RepID=A0ABQ6Z223_9ENTE|nr:DNA polymerase III subunit delta [Enterococcus sp. CU12B]KAF1305620.1 DNA polymerase III subunit delta [Enterococcus sp. CU12B]
MNTQQAIQAIHSQKFQPIYLVLGTEDYLQTQVREAFLQTLQLSHDDLNFAQFDLEQDSLDSVLDEAQSTPFFGDYRLIFAENPFFLTAEKKASAPEQNIDGLLDYLKNPADTAILVFFAKYDKLDERKKVTKQLKKAAESIEVQPMKEAEVRRYLQQTLDNDGLLMERDAFELFIRLTDMRLSKAMQELDKLRLYAGDKKRISRQAVEALVPKSLEHNVFDLTNDVLQGKTEEALRLYDDLHLQGEETIKINAILITQIRLLLQTAILVKSGYQQGNIAETLKVHPYRVKLAMQQVRKMRQQDLSLLYDELIENDYLVKSGRMDKEFLFQLFVLKAAQQIKNRGKA